MLGKWGSEESESRERKSGVRSVERGIRGVGEGPEGKWMIRRGKVDEGWDGGRRGRGRRREEEEERK